MHAVPVAPAARPRAGLGGGGAGMVERGPEGFVDYAAASLANHQRSSYLLGAQESHPGDPDWNGLCDWRRTAMPDKMARGDAEKFAERLVETIKFLREEAEARKE